jgi:glucose/arabinose dehydrogenase
MRRTQPTISTRSHSPRYRPSFDLLEDRLTPATLPTNFSETAVATGLSSATAMEFSPDGKLFVAEQAGTMEVWQNGTRLQANFFQNTPLSTDTVSERGLLGVTFDPNYATNRFVYVYYTTTAADRHNRLSRFTANANGDLALAGSETILLELDPHSAGNHNGGAIHFGPDGKLYVAVGDNANGANAQSLGTLHGKMLRLNANGTIPTDNPFFNQTTGKNQAIWALGLRNPFTFTFQPGTGVMHINDVGQNTWEEVNVGAPGANYGWPTTEGDFNQASFPNFTRPLYAYSHGSGTFQGFAITGGAFYNPGSPGINRFPTSFNGDYFFADFVNDWINVRDAGTGTVTRFATGALGTVDLRVANDGSLYYLARDSGSVFRVIFTANQAPSITQQPQNQTVSPGGSATFSVTATGSSPLTYQWQRAESGSSTFTNISGATSSSVTLTNAQAADNGDQFRVVVTNAFGSVTSTAATLTVTSNQAPSATINLDSGLTNGRFIAGQAINFSGTATDPEDGTLGGSRFTWRVDYITSIASGNPVVRPFVPEFGGQTSGTFTPSTTGPYTLTDVAYRITLTVTDSGGASTTVTRDVLPNTATLTVTTNPTGLQVTVDGQPFTSPRVFDSVVGFERPLGAAASQTLAGATYNFVSWSDGGAATHTVSTPLTNTTYTATYQLVSQGVSVSVNFQDGTSQGFSGYLADTGAVFGNRGNGFSYGWNANNSATARNRNATNSPDERYDTLQHMQKVENPNAVWEIAVPNGTYRVRVVSGDPSHVDSVFRTNVEGVLAINGTPTTAARWLEGVVTVTVTDGRLTLNNATGASNNKINFIEITSAAAPLQQDAGTNGLVVVEAENYDGNVGQGGKTWSPSTATAGFSGAGTMQALVNSGTTVNTGYVTGSPRLDYHVNFVRTGVHYVWIRGRAGSGSDDSIHVGLDGQAVASADRITGFGTAYGWSRNTIDGVVATINVPTVGVHTLNLWMREDGFVADKILLTTANGFTPTGTGPAESPRGGSGASALAASGEGSGGRTRGGRTAGLSPNVLEALMRLVVRWEDEGPVRRRLAALLRRLADSAS